jgi:membrane protein
MRIADLRRDLEDLLTRPGEQLGRGTRFVRSQIELWRFCARRLRDHNITALSAALSFRTIFALIPSLVLAFLFMRSVGMVADGRQALRQFMETSGLTKIVAVRETDAAATSQTAEPDGAAAVADDAALPDADPQPASAAAPHAMVNVADQIEALVDSVEAKLTFERLGPIGALLLIWTAMTLLTTIESALNRIFEAPASRALARRVILFWTAITLGPILIVAAVYVSRNALTTAENLPYVAWITTPLAWLTPGLVGILVVAAGYKLIPNTNVRFAAAIGGALVSVPAWMVARWAFAIYVERFVLQGNLYGVLGVVPLFLLWLNISWTIFLFGAELAHTAASLSRLRFAEHAQRAIIGPSDWLAVMLAIARPFQRGEPPPSLAELSVATGLSQESLQRMTSALCAERLIRATGDDALTFVPARPSGRISLRDIYAIADPRGERAESDDGPLSAAIAEAVVPLHTQLGGVPIARLIADDPPPQA